DGKRLLSQATRPDGTEEVLAWDAYSGAPLSPGKDTPPPQAGLSARRPDGRLLVSARDNLLEVRFLDRRPPPPPTLEDEATALHAWQVRQVEDCAHSGQWFAVAFHLERLLTVQPGDLVLWRPLALARLAQDRADAQRQPVRRMPHADETPPRP